MSSAGKKTILIAEDDPNTADLVAIYLEQEGFMPRIAQTGPEALSLAKRHQPVLVILDLMLPGMDGWEVFRHLRRDSDVPVIMLTARSEEIDRVAGLTLGADDYVVKPFSPRELVARVQAVLRRTTSSDPGSNKIYTYEDLVFNTEKRTLTLGKEPVSLTPHEYALLEALMQRPGRVFTRDELLDRVYPNREATVIDRVVDVH
ncbi:MAG: response regulator transcription factor, partial [Deltaproteobacteria bacterium]|nr:response regulator transcription factor [Deltaproteobacteria bacterium]